MYRKIIVALVVMSICSVVYGYSSYVTNIWSDPLNWEGGQRLWFIDDQTHVTALLPEDY